MMNARARGTPLVESKRYREAAEIVDEAIAAIRGFLQEHSLEEREEECLELAFLVRWREELKRKSPRDPAEKLREQLEHAIREENYERAAKLRDQLRKLPPQPDHR
jgi:excinuclease UvrABC helicase subunit UvrB